MKDDLKSPSNRLLRYVIATCYPKMIRRLGNKTWSKPYIDSLKQITTFQFDESKLDRDQVSEKETENDRQFLLKFVLSMPSLHTQVPKLIEQAKKARAGAGSKDFQLYTQDTCEEFHGLLNKLLKLFEDSLTDLKKARGNPKVSTKGSEEFIEKVDLVMLFGNALLRLSKGAALKMHLKTITHLLSRIHRTPVPGEEQEEPDEDLKAVQPFVSIEGALKPLATSYIDWLRLMVTNFNAVNILVQYFAGAGSQYDNISVKIVVAPPVDKRLLPWQELLTDPKLFPTGIEWDDSRSANANADISNGDILRFLENALETSSKVRGAKTAWSKRDLKHTISALKSLKSSKVLGWSKHAEKLLDKLKQLERPEEDKRKLVEEGPGNIESFCEITQGIQSLLESATFIYSLVGGQIFLGTLHCEVCLASLLSGKATVSEGVLEQMNVGYVSNLFLSPMSFL